MGWDESESTLSAVRADCTDDDNDLYSVEGGVCGPIDCDDDNPQVHPGMIELPNNGIDDDCDPSTKDSWTEGSTINAEYKGLSDMVNIIFFLFFPVGIVLAWKGWLRRRR